MSKTEMNYNDRPWVQEEVQQMVEELHSRKTIYEIAEIHQRTCETIRTQLQKLITDYYFTEHLAIEEIMELMQLERDIVEDAIRAREYNACKKEAKNIRTKVKQITESSEFWSLFDELQDDKSGFIHNRTLLLDAFRNGHLYGLEVEETQEMFNRRSRNSPLYCRGSFYLIPCLCIKYGRTVDILWTHRRARGNGFAKKLVRELSITSVRHPLEESVGFWKKLGIL
jgi:predicted DNA-binding protein YlxM (UPF0122 family)